MNFLRQIAKIEKNIIAKIEDRFNALEAKLNLVEKVADDIIEAGEKVEEIVNKTEAEIKEDLKVPKEPVKEDTKEPEEPVKKGPGRPPKNS